jgi:hypothetical protein
MTRLLLGGLLACVPLALSAQPLDQRPPKNATFAQAPSVSRVVVMPSPNGRGTQPPQDGTVTQMPAPDDQTPPPGPNDTVTAPPPPSNPADQAPLDNTVTSTPLPPAPPAEDQTDVPNPSDTANTPPVPGTGTQAQQGQPVPGGWVKMGSATLQALDKVNAVEKTLVLKVGDTARFASLDIAVRGCFVRPPDKPADATAFLVIRDQRAETPAFNGWMVRSAPYMSMMAHPLYDVRIAGCSP